jgi:hypothetical protein
MTTRSPERVEDSMTDPPDQRVEMTSLLLDHLEGSCACPQDQRVAMTTRSPERVEGSMTDLLDQRVAMTAPLLDPLEGSCACPGD